MPDSPSENKPADNKENMERHFFRASAEDFKKIPGSPIAYWVSKKMKHIFNNQKISEITISDGQTKTGDNEKFLRHIWEVNHTTVGVKLKWVKHPKGGGFRRWYGNVDTLIDWSETARKHYKSDHVARILPDYLWWKKGFCWTLITSGKQSFRLVSDDELFNLAAPTLFPKDINDLLPLLGLVNTTIAEYITKLFNPTINMNVGEIQSIPLVNTNKSIIINNIVTDLIELSRNDWNNFETSWDFKILPILNPVYQQPTVKAAYKKVLTHLQEMTLEMQRLEEENNRIFIEAYGLQDELTPEVPLKEITLTCNPHYRYGGDKTEEELEELLLADTMKEYISYAVGCMLGRYSIDKPGLILANQGETIDDYVRKVVSGQGLVDSEQKVGSDQWPVISEEKGEVGIDQWLVDSEKEEEEKSSDCEKFQGSDCLAEGNGSRGRGLSDNETIPKGRNLQFDQSASQSSCINSVEYSRGTGSSIDCGVQELSVDSSRFSGGSGNSITDSSTAELPDTGATFGNHDNTSGSKQNASGTHEQTNHSPLTTNHYPSHSPLTTNHLSFLPDEDNVIPILDEGWFSDDITERFKKFLKVTFGEENYEINLKFIEDSIGKDIRKYFLKDFYSDHVKRYKKRPIYWLFSSPKGSFNALIYMHRYQPDTASIVLNEYLREFRAKLSARKEHQEAISISSSASQKEKTQALKDIEKLKKTIEELDEYEREILYPLATRQISIDLDDGVKVNYLKFGAALKKIPGLDTVED